MSRLRIRSADGSIRTLPLEGESVSLGRAHDNGLCFSEDTSLSRHHLKFDKTGAGWWIRDLGSKNGTRVNDEPLTGEHSLRPGDRIEAGHILLEFEPPHERTTAPIRFYDDSQGETPPMAATIMTSLEGVLSGEKERRAVEGGTTAQGLVPGRAFDHPTVKALIGAGRELASNRPLAEMFPLILDLSLDAVGAERGAVITLDGDRLDPQATRGEDLKISTGVRERVLKDKSSVLVRDTQLDEAWRERVSIVGQSVHTMMAVPLQTNERVIGFIYVDSRKLAREFSADDLNLLTVLGNVAAIRIEQQRLAEVERKEQQMSRELVQAAEIQKSLLPARAPEIPGMELAGYNAACRTVGGDYFDYIQYEDGRIGVVIADVAGKGLPASLLMCGLQARVQVLAEDPDDLGRMMERLNRAVTAHCPANRFISLFFCVIDPATGRVEYCNAGHNPPLLIRAGGQSERLESGGGILGILPRLEYSRHSTTIEPGDLLALYSDGVTEATNPDGEEFGEDRLAENLAGAGSRPAAEVAESIRKVLSAWIEGSPPTDDVTMVVVRRI